MLVLSARKVVEREPKNLQHMKGLLPLEVLQKVVGYNSIKT